MEITAPPLTVTRWSALVVSGNVIVEIHFWEGVETDEARGKLPSKYRRWLVQPVKPEHWPCVLTENEMTLHICKQTHVPVVNKPLSCLFKHYRCELCCACLCLSAGHAHTSPLLKNPASSGQIPENRLVNLVHHVYREAVDSTVASLKIQESSGLEPPGQLGWVFMFFWYLCWSPPSTQRLANLNCP